ncbi:T9SS type A sorting domain-containing protein [Winogradskyella eckloniae]|uniref:T9SS type A sorting domain-containing protein n=1 Tax=Winogradskyella eckloniae TaxID=1089306 RepID=UPI0015637373|nr:T9SS type A sorting domain-containing protein [Winogradskyella eckloniae]NRD21281.1 T9SS type A sorting domain-containing protein [Winogradskyella eckloniae]
MKKTTFLISMLIVSIVSFAQSNITFSVDMAGQTFTQAYVSGSINGWSGDANPLTNTSGTIWEATLPLNDGEYEYKFTFDNWAGQDSFSQGDICTITNYGNTNRRLVVAGADMVLPTAMFGACAENTDGNDGPFTVTLSVDMSGYTGTIGTVFVNGENFNSQGFGAWCGSCGNEMTDMGSGIWEKTLTLEEFAYQFKFTVDGWTDQESFNPGDPETSTDGTFTNRYIKVDGNKTQSYVWNAPQQTLSIASVGSQLDNLRVYPNPAVDAWHIITDTIMVSVEVLDILGKNVVMVHPESSEVEINASEFNDGIYLARITTALGTQTMKLIKN